MFVNESKELEKTIGNVRISSNKKLEPMVDLRPLNIILHDNVKLKIEKINIIQQYIIPVILGGKDLICRAPTGSGKTLCYIIPIILQIIKNPDMKAVIICPVRELCEQIKNVCVELAKNIHILKKPKKSEFYCPVVTLCPITVAAIYGQKRDFYDSNEANILIATPGKLIDNLTKKRIDFNNLKIIVFDEADRLYDSTFKNQVDKIKSFVTTIIQTCMFSATYSRDICKLFDLIVSKERICFEAEFLINKNVKQDIYNECNKLEKIIEVLKGLTFVGNWRERIDVEKVIIFVEKKLDCSKIASILTSKGFTCATINGDKPQFERTEIINKFKTNISPILIATSVAARGLDIKDVKLVINYDIPRTIDEYIHRIGRTGRGGEEGRAVSFFDWNYDANLAKDLIKCLEDSKQEVPSFLLQQTFTSNNKKTILSGHKSTHTMGFKSQDKIRNNNKYKNNDKYKQKFKNVENFYIPNNFLNESLEDKIKDLNVSETPAESEDEELGAW